MVEKMNISGDITVVIKCLAYNHKPYIRDCLNGFVSQEANFKFLAIIHDDASTDGTAAIIREYEEKYPNIIKPIYETENQYSKHNGSLGNIINKAIEASGAKYVAICEGDDYWTDSHKLQKQVDFLESHPDYSMCFHAAAIKNETDTKPLTTCDTIQEKEYFTKDIFPGWVVPTASVMYRKKMIDEYPPLKQEKWLLFGDIVLFLKCTHSGKVWGMGNKMSVYRMTESGAVRTLNKEDSTLYYNKMCNHYKALLINFPEINKCWIKGYISSYHYTLFRKSKDISSIVKNFIIAFSYSPKYVIKKLLRMHPKAYY